MITDSVSRLDQRPAAATTQEKTSRIDHRSQLRQNQPPAAATTQEKTSRIDRRSQLHGYERTAATTRELTSLIGVRLRTAPLEARQTCWRLLG